MCECVCACVFEFILAHNSRSVQSANQPPHWAQDSLCGSVLPANSHLPVKKLADTDDDWQGRKCVKKCVRQSAYGHRRLYA